MKQVTRFWVSRWIIHSTYLFENTDYEWVTESSIQMIP